MAKAKLESAYYPQVQAFLRKLGYRCESKNRKRKPVDFIMRGKGQIVMDVFGIKSQPSRYSTEIAVAAVEVKRHTRHASLRYMVQALNNSRLAHYCYLAMPRKYSEREVASAAELGIGLLEIKSGAGVRTVSESKKFQPSAPLLKEFLRHSLGIAQCSICQNFTCIYDIPDGQRREGGGTRKNVFAIEDRWVYFCRRCRKQFENIFTERRVSSIERRISRLERRLGNRRVVRHPA